MSSRYKSVDTITSKMLVRDFKRWVVVFPDGDEITLNRKKYAIMTAEELIKKHCDVHIYEETVMRTIMDNKSKEDTFRIEITERIKYKLMEELASKMAE